MPAGRHAGESHTIGVDLVIPHHPIQNAVRVTLVISACPPARGLRENRDEWKSFGMFCNIRSEPEGRRLLPIISRLTEAMQKHNGRPFLIG